jgi:hypothetical protein
MGILESKALALGEFPDGHYLDSVAHATPVFPDSLDLLIS